MEKKDVRSNVAFSLADRDNIGKGRTRGVKISNSAETQSTLTA